MEYEIDQNLEFEEMIKEADFILDQLKIVTGWIVDIEPLKF